MRSLFKLIFELSTLKFSHFTKQKPTISHKKLKFYSNSNSNKQIEQFYSLFTHILHYLNSDSTFVAHFIDYKAIERSLLISWATFTRAVPKNSQKKMEYLSTKRCKNTNKNNEKILKAKFVAIELESK